MMKKRLIKKGEVVLITSGCYDSYGVEGLFTAKQQIDTDKTLQDFLVLNPEQTQDYSFEHTDYLEWLIDKGYLEKFAYASYHLGEYCKVSNVILY